MHRRLFAFTLLVLALVLAGGHRVTMAAGPIYVICAVSDATDFYIVVDGFGNVGGAVQQCFAWKGIPRGIVR